jgi:hypothetical protein
MALECVIHYKGSRLLNGFKIAVPIHSTYNPDTVHGFTINNEQYVQLNWWREKENVHVEVIHVDDVVMQ